MRQKKIALFDIDNTIYDGYILILLPETQLRKKMLGQECVDKLHRDLKLYRNKKVGYETTIKNIMLHWAEGLKGVSYQKVLDQAQKFLAGEGNKFLSFSRNVISFLKKTHNVYFITGEPQFVGRVASNQFSTTGYISTEFDVEKGIFTGKVKSSLAKREAKHKAIKALLKTYGAKDSFAFGDSEGDIKMLNSVEHAICINPTKGLRKIARKKGWSIVSPDNIEGVVREKIS